MGINPLQYETVKLCFTKVFLKDEIFIKQSKALVFKDEVSTYKLHDAPKPLQ